MHDSCSILCVYTITGAIRNPLHRRSLPGAFTLQAVARHMRWFNHDLDLNSQLAPAAVAVRMYTLCTLLMREVHKLLTLWPL
jgi:hypothetical protein